MKKSINLSSGRKSSSGLYKKAYIGSLTMFTVVVVVSIALISYRLILKINYDSLESQEQQLDSQLLALQDKKDKLIEIKSRLSDAKKIMASRAPTIERMATVTELVPENSEITTLSGDDIDLQINLESEDLASMGNLIESKISEIAVDKKRGIKKIEMRSFGLNPRTLKYTVSLGIEFI